MPNRKSQFQVALIFAFSAMAAGCSTPLFGYAQDRCVGAYNQCRNSCKDMPFGGAQSACYDRCLNRETQCYGTGDDGAGSTLSQEGLMGESRSEAEKQADYERWKAQREREREEGGETENETETEPSDERSP